MTKNNNNHPLPFVTGKLIKPRLNIFSQQVKKIFYVWLRSGFALCKTADLQGSQWPFPPKEPWFKRQCRFNFFELLFVVWNWLEFPPD